MATGSIPVARNFFPKSHFYFKVLEYFLLVLIMLTTKLNATNSNVRAFPVNIAVKLVFDSRYQDNAFKDDRVMRIPPALHTRDPSALDI